MSESLLSFKTFIHAFSGACGGVSAISVFYPLNVLRLRLQVNDKKNISMLQAGSELVSQEGFQALYRGWRATVTALGASNFTYFYFYNWLKSRAIARQADRSVPLATGTNLLLASVAGVVNVLTTTPLWVVGTRLALQRRQKPGDIQKEHPYDGVWSTLFRIAREEGVSALWNGTAPSLILVSNPTIQFVVYERVRHIFQRRSLARNSPITNLEFFIIGAVAKAVATVFTYPLQLAQSRLRAMRKNKDNEEQLNTFTILQKVVKKDGPQGMFRGIQAKLWQTVLTAAFMFMTYERIRQVIISFFLGKKPSGGSK